MYAMTFMCRVFPSATTRVPPHGGGPALRGAATAEEDQEREEVEDLVSEVSWPWCGRGAAVCTCLLSGRSAGLGAALVGSLSV